MNQLVRLKQLKLLQSFEVCKAEAGSSAFQLVLGYMLL